MCFFPYLILLLRLVTLLQLFASRTHWFGGIAYPHTQVLLYVLTRSPIAPLL